MKIKKKTHKIPASLSPKPKLYFFYIYKDQTIYFSCLVDKCIHGYLMPSQVYTFIWFSSE